MTTKQQFDLESLNADFLDGVQKAEEHIWKNRDKYRPEEGTFAAWAGTCAYNVAISEVRKKKPSTVSFDLNFHATIIASGEANDDEEQLTHYERLRNCLSKLPEVDQELLRNWHSCDAEAKKSLAKAKGVSYAGLASRVHRLRMNLIELLEKADLT